MVDAVRGAQRRIKIIIGVVGVDALAGERFQVRVGALLGASVGNTKAGRPMSGVERVGAEYAHSAARSDAAWAHMVGEGGRGAKHEKHAERRAQSNLFHE